CTALRAARPRSPRRPCDAYPRRGDARRRTTGDATRPTAASPVATPPLAAGRSRRLDLDLDGAAGAELLDRGGQLLEADAVGDERRQVEPLLLEQPDRVGEHVLADEAAEDRHLAARDPFLRDLRPRLRVHAEEEDAAAARDEVERGRKLRPDRVDDDVCGRAE